MAKINVITPANLGKGIKHNKTSKQWEVDLPELVDGDTITVNQEGKLVGSGSKGGLDCEAIAKLPVASWEKGVSILANKNGKCVRLVPQEDFFQEVGVGIATSKTSGYTAEEFEVVVTVSNTGVGKNELTDWVITKPAVGVYTIKDLTLTHRGVDRIETIDDYTYKLHGIESGGTAIVRFKVVPTSTGTFQFSSTVAPNSALDQNRSNNTATATLSVSQKADPSYVPSVDCPLITATELDHNTVLKQMRVEYKNTFVRENSSHRNIFAERESLKGLRIKLENASTVVCYTAIGSGTISYYLSNGRNTATSYTGGDKYDQIFVEADANKNSTFSGYTFENGILTVTEDVDVLIISCRPQGNNCRWQNYRLNGALPPKKDTITVSEVKGGTSELITKLSNEARLSPDDLDRIGNMFVVPNSVKINTTKQSRSYYNIKQKNATYQNSTAKEKLVFRVRSGTSASLKYSSTNNYASTLETRGKVTITRNSITVSADAKPTDSVNNEFIQVIVE